MLGSLTEPSTPPLPPPDAPLVPLPAQPDGISWPTRDWPLGGLAEGVDLDDLVARAFDPEGDLAETYAVVVVHHGVLVFERYDGLLPQWDRPGLPVAPGRHRTATMVRVRASIQSAHGKATVHLLRVEIGGLAVTGAPLDFLVQNFFRPFYPDAKIDEPFALAGNVDRIEVTPAEARVYIRR